MQSTNPPTPAPKPGPFRQAGGSELAATLSRIPGLPVSPQVYLHPTSRRAYRPMHAAPSMGQILDVHGPGRAGPPIPLCHQKLPSHSSHASCCCATQQCTAMPAMPLTMRQMLLLQAFTISTPAPSAPAPTELTFTNRLGGKTLEEALQGGSVGSQLTVSHGNCALLVPHVRGG